MHDDDKIAWVPVTITLPPELELTLEQHAQAAGLSLKCYCLHVLYQHVMRDVSADQKETWQQGFSATLTRNGCADNSILMPRV